MAIVLFGGSGIAEEKVEISRIPLFMEVGFWVEMKGCDDAEILLTQEDCLKVGRKEDDFPCYKGCTDIAIRTNFEAEIDGDVSHDIDMSHKEFFNGEETLVLRGNGNWHEIEVCVIGYKVELWEENAAGTKSEIGYLKISVKPTGSPP
jgi:hypothetical protein